MKKKSRQFTELVVFVLIILSLGVACQTLGEITNKRVPSTAPTQPDAAVMIHLERGNDYLQAADYDLAIASFDKAIELDPHIAFSYASRGTAYYYKNYFDEATTDFDRAVELDPTLFLARVGRAATHNDNGDFHLAIADYDKAIQLDPQAADAYSGRGQAYANLDEEDALDLAIADYDMAILLDPQYVNAYDGRGRAYAKLGETDKAVSELEIALDLGVDPSSEQSILALIAAITSEPIPGHWEGRWDLEPFSGPISFNIGTNGNIHNLELELYFGEEGSCIVNADEVLLEADHTFSYTFGESQEKKGTNIILGIFENDSLISGYLSWIIECTNASGDFLQFVFPKGGAWSAELSVGPPDIASQEIADENTDGTSSGLGDVGIVTPTPDISEGGNLPSTLIAVYSTQVMDTSISPLWDISEVSCEDKTIDMWGPPGVYLYEITQKDGGIIYTTVERNSIQEPDEDHCRTPWPNFGIRLLEPPEYGLRMSDYYQFCGYDHSRPPGQITISVAGTADKSIGFGTFQAVKVSTQQTYNFPRSPNYPQGNFITNEWYACELGLISSSTSHIGKYQHRDLELAYGLELISFTPISTNESYVRFILADVQLGDLVEHYRANINNEETAEALRRWDGGIRVDNIEEFERKIVDEQWLIVYTGTEDPVSGTDIILNSD